MAARFENSVDDVLNRILIAINDSGMDERAILVACKINTSFFNDWKKTARSGKIMEPSYLKISKISKYLNLSLDYIIHGKEISDSKIREIPRKKVSLNSLEDRANLLSAPNQLELMEYLDYLEYKDSKGTLQCESNKEESDRCEEINSYEDEYTELPMKGYVAAGELIDLPDEYSMTDIVSLPKNKASEQADFALKVKGDSMEPLIEDGEIVLVKMQPDSYNGQIVVASIDNTATLKKIYRYPDRIELHSINPKYPPIKISSEFIDFRIIGVRL
ncbi:MAG: S24 family peptidase [Peptostreptococcaceae bacterium]|nr:S24 family peptidase [Peptostreptococcaceae bacterium]